MRKAPFRGALRDREIIPTLNCLQILFDGDGELIGTGCGLVAAQISAEHFGDLRSVLAFCQNADGLQITITASDVRNVMELAVIIYIKIDLLSTDSLRCKSYVFH